jgi:hypothetical protein
MMTIDAGSDMSVVENMEIVMTTMTVNVLYLNQHIPTLAEVMILYSKNARNLLPKKIGK